MEMKLELHASSSLPRCPRPHLRRAWSAQQRDSTGTFQRASNLWGRSHKPAVARPVAAAAGPGEFFDSSVVQQEFSRLQQDMASMSSMFYKFADFDLEGKRIFLTHMEDFMDRFRIFVTRLKLAEDPLAKGMVRALNVQLLEASINLDAMYEGYKQQLDMMRALVDEEERTVDPERLRRLRAAFASTFGSRPMGINPSFIIAGQNPENFDVEDLLGIQDPKALLAFQEASEDPAAIEKYRDRPALYRLLKKIASGGRPGA